MLFSTLSGILLHGKQTWSAGAIQVFYHVLQPESSGTKDKVQLTVNMLVS